ncbi:bifunctional malic enzyme oxidoreductase/phosphotransacetylase [Marinicella pacifica]|uniref:NADP-dependent malic enzyme n=1 Tax=Marinicella pacifica TaxID=1171543 RepID=A0A917CUZ5_9GAMM|nr:NADP-dependent malic enzyme [Marinicella pacifica]GGF98551.1 bifunctional malic enzyme oxidoreductase/phosphotransacetylase [Marinicella pacifica]
MSLSEDMKQAALEYHQYPTPGKIKITATKALTTQKELALAYSPGVAAPSEAIAADPNKAADYTARSNMVAVISNGTAVLGLGDIGALASKPVMEGKGVLFKKFAGIDVFDIEIDEKDPDKLIEIIASLEPTFGGINLEDIKSPECFEVEEALKKRMKIPVFHDDQHGTAIITAAAVINALKITGKKIENVRLTTSGAGAAGMACLDLLVTMGMQREHIIVSDSSGVLYEGREDLSDPRRIEYAKGVKQQSLTEALDGADIFLGVSVAGVLKPDMLKKMAKDPLILALANPTPEIMPELALEVRPDAIIATGRSDYPNQVNNVLCFPYIFRGALDVGATAINDAMKIACVKALAHLARLEVSDVSREAYGDIELSFGRDYLIPQPFDPRILLHVAPAVAKAAMDSGVAKRPLDDLKKYEHQLSEFVYQSGLLMRPVFNQARKDLKRVVLAEGEDERVLRAVLTINSDRLAKPILIGRPDVVQSRIERIGINLTIGEDFELVNPQDDPRFYDYWTLYHKLMERRGVSPEIAKAVVRTRTTVIAALMVKRGEADAMLAGLNGRYHKVLQHIIDVIGLKDQTPSSLSAVATDRGSYFITDTNVNPNPTAEEIASMAISAAERVRAFGKTPRLALLSYSNFGTRDGESPEKMREALALIKQQAPDLQVEGEMDAEYALVPNIRSKVFPSADYTQKANLLVMPNLDTATTALNMIRYFSEGVTVGPMLMGTQLPAHVLNPSSSVRRIFNMVAIAAVDAQNTITK